MHNGQVDFSSNTLVKYSGSWWHVSGGRVNFSGSTVCKYNGTWWYVHGGRVDFGAKTLVKYNGIWWFVENGQINWNDETLVKYGNNWFYVRNGHVDWSYSGDCRYDGTFYTVENGVMTGVNEGKIWKYDTRYAYKYKDVKWADGTWIMDEEEDRIDSIDYNYYYSNIVPTEDEKNGCIYLAAGGDSIAQSVCKAMGWSY